MNSRILRFAAATAFVAGFGSAHAAADVQVVSKVQPEFPKEAAQAGVDRGHVKVRLSLEASGEVSRVEILEANPRRIFDRAVVKTMTQWRFNAGDANRAVEMDVDFQR